MAQQYDNTNRGALFPNERKTQDNHPDYRGNVDVEGVEYWVSAWVKDTAKGEILSMSLTPKTATGGPQQNRNQQAQNGARTLGQGKPHQSRAPGNNPPPSSGEPPMDFDDIPF